MTRVMSAVMVLTLLAACGVDGAPEPPATPGMTITGTVRAGIGTDGS